MTWSDSLLEGRMAGKGLKCSALNAHSKHTLHGMGSGIFYLGEENTFLRVGETQHKQEAEPGVQYNHRV